MEEKTGLLTPLLERVEQYGKTSFELIKLRSLDKAADAASMIITRAVITAFAALFLLTLTIAAGLWLGELLGKTYYGFLAVAMFYGAAGLILLFFLPSIKARINNSIITQWLN